MRIRSSKLGILAGIAWDEMTPRPSYGQLKDFLKLEEEFFHEKSTRKVVDSFRYHFSPNPTPLLKMDSIKTTNRLKFKNNL